MCETCNWDTVVDVANTGLNLVQQIEEQNVSDTALKFAEAVGEKLTSMKAWIEERGHVTPAMERAIDNMVEGARRWLH